MSRHVTQHREGLCKQIETAKLCELASTERRGVVCGYQFKLSEIFIYLVKQKSVNISNNTRVFPLCVTWCAEYFSKRCQTMFSKSAVEVVVEHCYTPVSRNCFSGLNTETDHDGVGATFCKEPSIFSHHPAILKNEKSLSCPSCLSLIMNCRVTILRLVMTGHVRDRLPDCLPEEIRAEDFTSDCL